MDSKLGQYLKEVRIKETKFLLQEIEHETDIEILKWYLQAALTILGDEVKYSFPKD